MRSNMTQVLCVLLLLSVLLWGVQSSKILVVISMPSHSHFSLGFRLAKELADRGHQVTSINSYPQKTPIKNYKDVSIAELVTPTEQKLKNMFEYGNNYVFKNYIFLDALARMVSEGVYNSKNVQDLLDSGEKFDVMVMEHFINDALLGIALHFKIPVVLIGSHPASSFNNYIFANPSPSSYIPNVNVPFSKHMNFWQRIQNLYYDTVSNVMRELYYLPSQIEIFKKHIKTDLELDDLLRNVSLMLVNSHVSVNDAVPHVPNMIEIGGYHINPPKKLPTELQKFLDESNNGVVLFSMGSNLKSKDLKPETRDAILRTFSKIKQNVLWKFEEELPNVPKNVKVMKWVPQQDLLAHPKVQAFISHGGLLSSIETVYFGVPIIGIPIFGDQRINIAAAVLNGYALSVPLAELTEKKLSWALDEILNNPKYRENAQRRSKIMRDQPLKPIDSAVYWVEYVIRHQGAPHLRNGGVDLRWYERNMVDIFIVLSLATIVLFVVFYIIIRKILGLCTGKQPKVTKTKKHI